MRALLKDPLAKLLLVVFYAPPLLISSPLFLLIFLFGVLVAATVGTRLGNNADTRALFYGFAALLFLGFFGVVLYSLFGLSLHWQDLVASALLAYLATVFFLVIFLAGFYVPRWFSQCVIHWLKNDCKDDEELLLARVARKPITALWIAISYSIPYLLIFVLKLQKIYLGYALLVLIATYVTIRLLAKRAPT